MKNSSKPINAQTAIASHDRCCGCGICAAICPVNCIKMKFDKNLEYKPFVDSNACIACGLCIQVCPDNQRTNIKVEKAFRESYPNNTKNNFLGDFFNCYVGCVTRLEDRSASASGGILTAILEELLARNVVNAVVLVGASSYERTGKFFKATIVENVENVRRNRGSKYYPVEFSDVIKKVESENRSYAIVALPCVTLAIRKAELYHKKLKENIRYIFSPVCGHGVSAAYTEYLLKTNGIEPSSVVKISYRDKTGISKANDYNFLVEYRGEKGIRVKRLGFISSEVGKVWCNYLFTPNKCLYCTDFAGELSDASFADAWLPEYTHDVNGNSIVIVRNGEIGSLVKDMIRKGKLRLSSIPAEKVIEAQWSALQFKKESIKGRIRLKKFHQDFPDYMVNWREPSIIKAAHKNWRILLNMHLSRWLYRNRLLRPAVHLICLKIAA